MIRAVTLASLLALSACNGFDTGLNPRPDVRKEQGPLTVPPPSPALSWHRSLLNHKSAINFTCLDRTRLAESA